MIRTYYLSKARNQRVSGNFVVKEFASHDGADKLLIDDALVNILQNIRNHFGKPVTITSAYRTASYNAAIGGSKSSYHVKGQAADIKVKDVNPVIVGIYAQSINVGGIGVYAYSTGGFVHVDTRAVKYRWLTIIRGGTNQGVPKIMPTIAYKRSNPTNAVKLLQRNLGVSETGSFGITTHNAVIAFQTKKGLAVDGIVGEKTWTKLFS